MGPVVLFWAGILKGIDPHRGHVIVEVHVVISTNYHEYMPIILVEIFL